MNVIIRVIQIISLIVGQRLIVVVVVPSTTSLLMFIQSMFLLFWPLKVGQSRTMEINLKLTLALFNRLVWLVFVSVGLALGFAS